MNKTFYKTGYQALDKYLNGFSSGELIVFGSRARSGMLNIMQNFAANLVINSDYKACVSIITNKFSREQIHAGFRIIEQYREKDLFPENTIEVVYEQSETIQDFKVNLEHLLNDKYSKIFFIDLAPVYFEKKSEFYKILKQSALKSNKVVIINVSFNSNIEKRADKLPKLSDLQNQSIIQDIADKIILFLKPYLYRIRDENGYEQKGKVCLKLFNQDNENENIVELIENENRVLLSRRSI